MTELGITLGGQTFEHLVYHFVLTYSNWEAGTICYSESLESLSEGWQNAVWELGTTTHYPTSALPRTCDHHASASSVQWTISGGPATSPHARRLAVRAYPSRR